MIDEVPIIRAADARKLSESAWKDKHGFRTQMQFIAEAVEKAATQGHNEVRLHYTDNWLFKDIVEWLESAGYVVDVIDLSVKIQW